MRGKASVAATTQTVATRRISLHMFRREFIVVFPDALRALGRDGNAGALALRVLTWAWENLSHDSWELIDIEPAAADRCMSPSGFRKGITRLAAEGILESKGRNPRRQWRISPVASWRGGAERFEAEAPARIEAAAASAAEVRARPKRARKAKGKTDGARGSK